jgi:hypothetical protein
LSRRREGEAAGTAVEVLRHKLRLPGDEMDFDIVPFTRALACQMEMGYIAIFKMIIGRHSEFEAW